MVQTIQIDPDRLAAVETGAEQYGVLLANHTIDSESLYDDESGPLLYATSDEMSYLIQESVAAVKELESYLKELGQAVNESDQALKEIFDHSLVELPLANRIKDDEEKALTQTLLPEEADDATYRSRAYEMIQHLP